MLYFLRRNHAAILITIAGFLAVFAPSHFFESFQLGLGPEFLMKACGKLFYLGLALASSQYIVKKFFPTVDSFCSRPSLDAKESEFTTSFKERPRDPRLWPAVFVHAAVFLGVCLLFALAF